MKRSKKWRTAPETRSQKRARYRAWVDTLLRADLEGFAWSLPQKPQHWLSDAGLLTLATADDSIDGTGRVVLPEKAIEDVNANDRPL